jgi:UDP-N-acetyl-D-mannosaminuronate dehydrogenase
LKNKNVVAGLGEIGLPILKLISKATLSIGYDINPKLNNEKKLLKYANHDTEFLHICTPFTKKFQANVLSLYKKFSPKIIVIHSTVSPYSTKNLQKQLPIPVIYSATRGVHKRMLYDLKRYKKFFAIESNAPHAKLAIKKYSNLMRKCGVKTKKVSNPLTLELAKIVVDTSYYGWLINYAQISNMIAIQNKIDYNEMWSFADEIHKLLGNRPKMYPGFIGGHCVIPNLNLLGNKTLNQINMINKFYSKKVKN